MTHEVLDLSSAKEMYEAYKQEYFRGRLKNAEK